MLVGDSVTQGSAGDLTWRYRLWEHLRESGVVVDLVGPYRGLYDNVHFRQGFDDYVDPNFDQDHAAQWGMAYTTQEHPVGELIEDYHPDVVVDLLGFNDLVGQGASPDEVLGRARTFVTDARAADPAVTVVLGELPQAWWPAVATYDAGLSGLADSLNSDEAPVVVAATGDGFVDGVDTWDPAHLTASGEVKLTAGLADALAGLGIGTPYPRPLPDVENGPRVGATLIAAPQQGAVELTWMSAPGVTAENVWLRDVTAGADWQRLPYPVQTGTFTATGLSGGHDYEFRVQPIKGAVSSPDVFSNVVTATPD
jgi:hypothetical protein